MDLSNVSFTRTIFVPSLEAAYQIAKIEKLQNRRDKSVSDGKVKDIVDQSIRVVDIFFIIDVNDNWN